MPTEKLIQSNWNPIRLNESSNTYTPTTSVASAQWYNSQMQMSSQRKAKLIRYNEMDVSSVEISRALDILAEDISSMNGDDEPTFFLDIPDNLKLLKSQIKLFEETKDLWASRSGMERDFFNRVRKTLKYGASFYLREEDDTLKELHPERIVGHVHDPNDEDIVTHYIYDPSAERLGDGNQNNSKKSSMHRQEYVLLPVADMLILKVGDGPYGKSVLNNVHTVWKQMSLLEDSVVIYRVVRAPERTVYYIDVGNLQGPKRKQAIEEQRQKLSQKQVNRRGQVQTEYDPHSTSEDIFIPTNSNGKGSRVERLEGGQSLGELSDVEWFAKKLAAGLRIPYSMFDTSGQNDQQYTDMRVGQVYQMEIRYFGYIRRLQSQFSYAIDSEYKRFSRKRGVLINPEIEMDITPPTSFAKYKDMEIFQAQLNVYSTTTAMPNIAKKFALQRYLDLDHEELSYNETEILKQKGLAEEIIKTMEQEEVDNIVYGDGRLGVKYGLQPIDPNGGFGGGFA